MLSRSHAATRFSLGPTLIGVGLCGVIAAEHVPFVPVASTIVLIAWGATFTLQSMQQLGKPELLALANYALYATLTCLAIAAQSHNVSADAARATLPMLADHAAAIMLLFALGVRVLRSVCYSSLEDL